MSRAENLPVNDDSALCEICMTTAKRCIGQRLSTDLAWTGAVIHFLGKRDIMRLASIPRRRYTTRPTDIEFLPRLTETLSGPEIYIKRDDLLGLAGGGNKTRKLEFVMADAISKGADTVITTGAVQSNHCRLTLAAAVKEGLKCQLLIEERVPGSYHEDANGNNLLFKLLGVDRLVVVPTGTDLIRKMNDMADEAKAAGGRPYVIVGGASNALGALGYVSCAEEILAQMQDMAISFDRVICASGSGGTHAGLVAGFFGNQSGVSVLGISTRADKEAQERKILALANETSALAGGATPVPKEEVEVLDDFVGPGYSLPTAQMTEAMQLFARTEGILLDPVYTGKAAAGLVALARKGAFRNTDKILFVHTGGSPSIYAYPDEVLANVPA